MEFHRLGFPVDADLAGVLSSYPLPRLDDFKFLPTGTTFAEKKAGFLDTLRSLKPGLTQINAMPAVESEALKRITEQWQPRVWDYEILRGDEVWNVIREEGILVVGWQEIMQRFEGRPADSE
jgi:hypothetical protein